LRVGAPQAAGQAGSPNARDVLTPARALGIWLAAVRLRLGDHLFADSDTEASWRSWQVVKVHGGLGRFYRDPLFDTLRL
jgi:hypothetical protein